MFLRKWNTFFFTKKYARSKQIVEKYPIYHKKILIRKKIEDITKKLENLVHMKNVFFSIYTYVSYYSAYLNLI